MSGDQTTARLTLARALWAYGEDSLWPQIHELTDQQVTLVKAIAAKRLEYQPQRLQRQKRIREALLASSVIQVLEGAPRPLARSKPREFRHIPAKLRGWPDTP